MIKFSIKWRLISIFFVFVIFFWLSVPYYSGDVKNHYVWAQSIANEGAPGFYNREFHDFAFPNYPPFAMLSFVLSLKAYELSVNLTSFLNSRIGFFPSNLIFFLQDENVRISFMKLPAILSNFGIIIALYYLVTYLKNGVTKSFRVLLPLLILLNPSLIYLSIVWGQIDLLPVMFLLFSLLAILKRRLTTATVLMLLALLSKQTIILFWPIFLFWLLKEFGFLNMLRSILLTVILFYISYIPFNNTSFIWPFELYKLNFSMVAQSVGENVFNLWGLLFDFRSVSDQQTLSILTLQQVGYLLFILATLVPTSYLLSNKLVPINIFIYLLIISLTYFYFFTRMHERYLAPAIVFSYLPVIINKKFILIPLFFTIFYLLNLYRGLYQPDIAMFNFIVSSATVLKFLAILYLIFLIFLNFLFVRGILKGKQNG